MELLLVLLTAASAESLYHECKDGHYLDNTQLMERLEEIATNFPDLASTYTIGFSARGVPLRVIKLSSAPEEAMVPQVKLIGGIHGNEPPSTHVLLNFAQHLLHGHAVGERYVKWILNNTRIHILPRLNPDGFTDAKEGLCSLGPGRRNANGVDLNRGFPRAGDADSELSMSLFEAEVQAVISWSQSERFTLGASLHSGALVTVYPLDAPIDQEERNGRTTDEDVFRHLAKTYARNHRTMGGGVGCTPSDRFSEGIVNGAEWYHVSGTMMDYNYLYASTMELTVELHCCKYPPPFRLCHIWDQNKLALSKFVAEAVQGVRGTVTSNGIPLENALVNVLGRDMPVLTNSRGQFFRVLLSGRYFLEVEMVGMVSQVVEAVIERQDTAFLRWTEVNVDLQPEGPDFQPAGTVLVDEVDEGTTGGTALAGTDGEGGASSLPPWNEDQGREDTAQATRGGLEPDTSTSGYPLSTGEWSTSYDYEYLDRTLNETSILTRKVIHSEAVQLRQLFNVYLVVISSLVTLLF